MLWIGWDRVSTPDASLGIGDLGGLGTLRILGILGLEGPLQRVYPYINTHARAW